MPAAPPVEARRRLHVVTGKGGTGKTTVAAALAIALASGGRRVLLMEVEDRQGIAQLFDTPPLPYEERPVAVAPGHGQVVALAVDAEEALLDYLDMFYNMRRAGRMLKRMGAIDFATTIAPGVRDVLLTGKLKEAVDRGAKTGRRVYDAVVLDAPPTGRIARFLNVTAEVGTLTRAGPIKTQSDSVTRVIRSPQTAVHLVTVLEEMPVQETVDGVAELRAADIPVGHVIVNMHRQPYPIPARLGRTTVRAGLRAAGLPADKPVLDALLAEAADLRSRIALQERERIELDRLGLPIAALPMLTGAVDLGGLYRLAETLAAQGVSRSVG
ncbi:MAG TPA: ArsA-related P-loop ATPase [Mycobacteriales bacterium]|nr:ArsA-related P-loop ATPase [Mycobacteriales bacterium]